MKSKLHKDPLIVAVSVTLLALMILPHRRRSTVFGWDTDLEYWFVTSAQLKYLHWPSFVAEIALIWLGFLLYKHITKPDENE